MLLYLIKSLHASAFGAEHSQRIHVAARVGEREEVQELHPTMKHAGHGQVIGFPISSVTYEDEQVAETSSAPEVVSSYGCLSSYEPSRLEHSNDRKDSVMNWMSKFSRKANNYAKNLGKQVTSGPKISETMKGKLSMGKRILQAGSVERMFRQSFSVGKREKLVKALQCNLSTTAGPISGMLFISTEKIAFHSNQSIKITSPKGNLAKVPYKVLIPLNRIKRVNQSKNLDKPSQKYVQIVTVDEFEFWFMGFGSCQKSLKHSRVQQAKSELQAICL